MTCSGRGPSPYQGACLYLSSIHHEGLGLWTHLEGESDPKVRREESCVVAFDAGRELPLQEEVFLAVSEGGMRA